jgi:hypothetical protein
MSLIGGLFGRLRKKVGRVLLRHYFRFAENSFVHEEMPDVCLPRYCIESSLIPKEGGAVRVPKHHPAILIGDSSTTLLWSSSMRKC